MLQVIWDTRGYFFWLLVVSAFCLVLERIWPWRKQQKMVRRQFVQDLFWLFFNGHYAGILVAYVAAYLFMWALPSIEQARDLNLLAATPAGYSSSRARLLHALGTPTATESSASMTSWTC